MDSDPGTVGHCGAEMGQLGGDRELRKDRSERTLERDRGTLNVKQASASKSGSRPSWPTSAPSLAA
jgi:hypothetical protein